MNGSGDSRGSREEVEEAGGGSDSARRVEHALNSEDGAAAIDLASGEQDSVAGSGSNSKLVCSQCGQTHSRDLRTMIQLKSCHTTGIPHSAARRFRSAVGYSIDPTPTAACPLSGKKPCKPMIAGASDCVV